MTTPQGTQNSMGQVAALPRPAGAVLTDDTSYCIGACSAFMTESEAYLVVSQKTQQAHQLPASIWQLANACTALKPLSQHAKDVLKALPWRARMLAYAQILKLHVEWFEEATLGVGGMQEMLAKIFSRLVDEGIMVSWGERPRARRYRSSGAALASHRAAKAEISAVVVMTCDRVDRLERCLDSYMTHCLEHGRQPDFVICDDSRDAEVRRQNREVGRTLRRRHQVPVRYVGHEEREAWIEVLAKRGIPEDVLRFGLFDVHGLGPSYGANRNAALLQTAGEMIFCADDDTICDVGRPPAYQPGLKVGADPDKPPYELSFYADREAAIASVMPEETCLLELQEQLLGQTLPGCLAGHTAGDLDLRHMDPAMRLWMERGVGRVLATFPGLVGDSGSDSPLPALFSSGPQRQRLLQSLETYRTATQGREQRKVSAQMNLVRAGGCMTTFFGLDHRTLLPPFFPVFRMEDATFGESLTRLCPDGLFGYLPCTLAHQPEHREHQSMALTPRLDWSAYDLLKAALQGFAPLAHRTDQASGMKLMGQYLQSFAAMPLGDYLGLMQETMWGAKAQELATYKYLLSKHPKSPSYWQQDVKAYLAQCEQMLLQPGVLAPMALVHELGPMQATQTMQQLLGEYGRLLHWWPDVIEATRHLRQQGHAIARLL